MHALARSGGRVVDARIEDVWSGRDMSVCLMVHATV